MSNVFDALVIGGGPAGSTTALLLAQAGWSVILVERKTFPRRKVCGEYLSASNLPLLRVLGIGEQFEQHAGPAVTDVGLFAGRTVLKSPLPQPTTGRNEWGRALSRESLDTLLLNRAVKSGVVVRQPCWATVLERMDEGYRCRIRSASRSHTSGERNANDSDDLFARIVIAAHGSWDIGTLPTQPSRMRPAASDLFGFKAHFKDSALPDDLMPLIAFPGGYGGMVHCDGGRASLSLCIRRDSLSCLSRSEGATTGEAVLGYITDRCDGVKQALKNANRQGDWLAIGPIRPGIRLPSLDRILSVGNAAGEAHPVVAEGISMAMQGGWLLADHLKKWDRQKQSFSSLSQDYAKAWRRAFATRLRASTLIAQWAMRSTAVTASLPLLSCFPHLLTWGARLSGKATQILRCDGI